MKAPYNLSQIESQTWRGFLDFIKGIASDGSESFRIRCWDTPYSLQITPLLFPKESIAHRDDRFQMCLLREDEIMGFKFKFTILVSNKVENQGYWGSVNGCLEAFSILSIFTMEQSDLLSDCQYGDLYRNLATFKSFLQALEAALVRMVLMPDAHEFLPRWRHYFYFHIHNMAFDQEEFDYLLDIHRSR